MKKAAILYALVFVLITFGPTAWAQTTVTTESELRTAIQVDGANITVTADIELSNSTLSIPTGNTVTIDLNGHTLDRKLTSRGEGGGQVITVRSGATLYLSNGTLKGGWGGNGGGIANEGGTANLTDVIITGCKGDDRGGGISNLSGGTLTMTGGSITNNTCYDHGDPAGGGGMFNAEGATATLTGVTITGNEDMVCGGGGICNYGTILLDGCTITGNKARTVGGGIWSTNKNSFKMQGSNIITDNIAGGVPSNIFLKAHCLITLTSSITGSRIGVMLDVAPYWFVDGFATYHSGEDPNTFFTCDKPWVDSLAIIQPEPWVLHVGDVIMLRKNLKGKVPYIEHSWDSENQKVVSTTKILTEEIGLNDTPTSETQYKKLKSSNLFVTLGTENSELHEYYVAEGDELNIKALDIVGPNVHIILRDSARLHIENDIGVEKGNTVYFHAQSTGSFIGKLTSGGGIGGAIVDDGADIEIHGGNFDLQGAESCAAIGGKYTTNGNITIYDGHIKATGGDSAAGIGSGYGCENYGNITIYGGKIDATGSAGIGGGQGCLNGKLTIWDGAITARGQSEAAGIGGSQYGSDYAAGTITINGGYIRAYGATHGAGIGGGDGKRGGTLNVNGGRVEAYGGTDAAGIGGGEGGNGGIVNITGGYVYAEGNDNGAGIGGGEDGAGANVTINGGVVVVKAGQLGVTGMRGIGPGYGSDNYGSLTIGDNMMVSSWNGNEGPYPANLRKDYCWYRTQARIEPCTHPNATYSDGGSSVNIGCSYCLTGTMPYTFNANGNWNDGSKWFAGFMPHNGNDVAVKAEATVPTGCCANVGNITIDGGSLTIADGGQLIHNNAGVTATVQKAITGHGGDNNGGWNFIASPMVTDITPADTNGFLTDNYDLYYYDEPSHYWMNHKGSEHGHFGIEPQKGYLYASYDNTTLSMTGMLQPSNEPVTIDSLSHSASALTGFNLVGNPFACNATIDRPFYVIDGNHVVAYEGSDPIAPGIGVMVQADAEHESVTFTKVTPEAQASQPNNGSLQIALTQANTRSSAKIDNAIVSFTEGSRLEKFHFGNDAKLYIPQGGKDYAIAPVGTDAARHVSTEIPLNFKATENGEYTLTVNPEGVEMNYLHLIDNKTSTDIDLLVNPSYTFDARTTDYESRFRLMFVSVSEDADGDNEAFAFYSNGSWIIANEGDATLQVIDMMGRILSSETISGSVSKTIDAAPGVYILKLNDKVQKIVIE